MLKKGCNSLWLSGTFLFGVCSLAEDTVFFFFSFLPVVCNGYNYAGALVCLCGTYEKGNADKREESSRCDSTF